MSERVQRIESALHGEFEPDRLEIVDESHLHAGHAGAREGGGHFRVTIVSERFAGHSRVERHRMLYEALGAMMEREIHALAIHAFTPEEWERESP